MELTPVEVAAVKKKLSKKRGRKPKHKPWLHMKNALAKKATSVGTSLSKKTIKKRVSRDTTGTGTTITRADVLPPRRTARESIVILNS